MIHFIDPDKDQREKTTCIGCGNSKQVGLVVCWTCFKQNGIRPAYKYFNGSLQEWLSIQNMRTA